MAEVKVEHKLIWSQRRCSQPQRHLKVAGGGSLCALAWSIALAVVRGRLEVACVVCLRMVAKVNCLQGCGSGLIPLVVVWIRRNTLSGLTVLGRMAANSRANLTPVWALDTTELSKLNVFTYV